ncbi:MAG: hypothetical protein CL910_15400 [Deltaproteobacteria bacterium]|nr:hypothetical protein [Deltaproteobacteria bacterium]
MSLPILWARIRLRMADWLRCGSSPGFHSVLKETVAEQRRSSFHSASDEFEGAFVNPQSQN